MPPFDVLTLVAWLFAASADDEPEDGFVIGPGETVTLCVDLSDPPVLREQCFGGRCIMLQEGTLVPCDGEEDK
jgi:hypothetical protein